MTYKDEFDYLADIVIKLKAYSVLPEPQYAAVCREILQDINKAKEAMQGWRNAESEKLIESYVKLGDSGAKLECQVGGYTYIISVEKTKTKK